MRRRGFTIVELLVALALIVFIMYILSDAFATGLKTFRDLKAVGDMNERLRGASNLIRRYLAADHFEGRKKLSDPDFWKDGPPREGFFRVWQGSPSTLEGTDVDGNPSVRSVNHILHFTAKLRGNDRSDVFSATVPAGSPLLGLGWTDSRYQDPGTLTYNYPWAEVAFYLRPSGSDTTVATSSGGAAQQLYTLYFRQRLLVQDSGMVTGIPAAASPDYAEVSHTIVNGALRFNSPQDITVPMRRFGTPTGIPSVGAAPNLSYPTLAEENPSRAGADVLLTDVVSFNVRLLVANGGTWTEFADLLTSGTTTGLIGTGTGQFRYLNNSIRSGNGRAFDTWSSLVDPQAGIDYSGWRPTSNTANNAYIPMFLDSSGVPIRVRGIQVTIRIWDLKTEQTRQVTIVQDL
jgi:prepilin-type N-terminal cleavage/methylation domain-containing protein